MEATQQSVHESFDAKPGNQTELSTKTGVRLLYIVGSRDSDVDSEASRLLI